MPIPEGVETDYIINNMEKRIQKYNLNHDNYVGHYKNYINKRNHYIEELGDLSNAVREKDFILDIEKILIEYGMNSRNSELMNNSTFQNTLINNIDVIDEIENSKKTISSITNNAELIKKIKILYNKLSKPQALTLSGGFVIASKTMHFLFPELFIMIDGAHIGISLYNIDDYVPHPIDGKNWYSVFSDYSGKKSNPSPRGNGRRSWDSERYCMALFYYKRLFYEWIDKNDSNENAFIKLDQNSNYIPRILDKALW